MSLPEELTIDDFEKLMQNFECVMCTTFNQMVNFIPLYLGKISKSYILTIQNNTEFNTAEWNLNLIRTLRQYSIQVPQNVEVSQHGIKNVETIMIELGHACNESNKKIFWNITGGQRPYVLAVQKLAKCGDIIGYIEGASGELILYEVPNNVEDLYLTHSIVKIDLQENINLATALSLMGFDHRETTRSENKTNLLNNQFKEIFEKLAIEFINNANLRMALVQSNKQKLSRSDAKANVRAELIALESDFQPTEIDNFINDCFKDSTTYPFGYILEYLVAFTILANGSVSSKLADISVSANLHFADSEISRAIDEFDIVMLTKSGQIIMIECKSGSMSGDVAKSTKYSVYAAAGVYGKPILITPLLSNEVNDKRVKDNKDYESIFEAYRSAKRANLSVWHLDTLVRALSEKLFAYSN